MLELQGSTGRAQWHLHPPFLRAMGLQKKLRIPYRIAFPLMRILAKGKVLRGTPFDLFGYAKVRKVEREVRDEYVSSVLGALKNLRDENYDHVVDMASLAMDVRGFEEIKLRAAEKFLTDLKQAANKISSGTA